MVVINIILPTTDGWPKPGENVRLDITTSSKKEVIAILLTFLQSEKDKSCFSIQFFYLILIKWIKYNWRNTWGNFRVDVFQITNKVDKIQITLKDNEDKRVPFKGR